MTLSSCANPSANSPRHERPPVMLWACRGITPEPWLTAFAEVMPELEIRLWPQAGDPADISYAFVWKVPEGVLAQLPNLELVLSLGAGVDPILSPKVVPPHLPIIRMVDPGLKSGMAEFVLMQCLYYHRAMPVYAAQQARQEWREVEVPLARHRTVGLMGLGELGAACARHLVGLGFQVRGWARSAHELPGVRCFHGPDGLAPFLSQVEILVCLLPLTADSRGILNAALFGQMPPGAFLINVARGGHLVDEDLLAALASGQIAGATLDVFHTEPLPPGHPFWTHPRVVVVPHASAPTQPETAALTVVENIRRHRAGQPLQHVVNRATGY